jgi:SpoIIAA-like
MIEHTLDSAHSILYVRPKSKLEQDDFVQLAKAVDPHIEEKGDLAGLIIEVASFPGWESLGAMASHCRFVRAHHKHVKKIGVVTDSPLGNVAEHLASHLLRAEEGSGPCRSRAEAVMTTSAPTSRYLTQQEF